jgi:hypothetical protein
MHILLFVALALLCHSLALTLTMVTYPVKIKSVITKLTASTQKALQAQSSRMLVELPPATSFGVEKGGSNARTASEGMTPEQKIKQSNREAARLFTEMFSMLSSTTVCVFPSEAEASAARNLYGAAFRGQCLSIDSAGKGAKGMGKLRSRKFTAEEQEAALLGTDGIYVPDGTEVLIIAGPRAKDFKKIKKIHDKLGEGCVIILLNSRVDNVNALNSDKKDEEDKKYDVDFVYQDFVNVFTYCPPVLLDKEDLNKIEKTKKDLLLYHEFKGKYYLAEKDDDEATGGFGNIAAAIKGTTFNTLREFESAPAVQTIVETLKECKIL